MNENKSYADRIIEVIDKVLIKNGLPPVKRVNKTGSLIIVGKQAEQIIKKQSKKGKTI